MPEAGFFRYPLSYACPNKVTLMKGKVQVSNGQHYVQLDEDTTTCQREHEKRYPIEKNFTQVHHFKWDSSVFDRLQEGSLNLKKRFEQLVTYYLINTFF